MRTLFLPFVYGLGHLVRCVTIAAELQRRGHSVHVACGRLGVDLVRTHGLPASCIHEVLPFPASGARVDNPAFQAGLARLIANPLHNPRLTRQ